MQGRFIGAGDGDSKRGAFSDPGTIYIDSSVMKFHDMFRDR